MSVVLASRFFDPYGPDSPTTSDRGDGSTGRIYLQLAQRRPFACPEVIGVRDSALMENRGRKGFAPYIRLHRAGPRWLLDWNGRTDQEIVLAHGLPGLPRRWGWVLRKHPAFGTTGLQSQPSWFMDRVKDWVSYIESGAWAVDSALTQHGYARELRPLLSQSEEL